MDFLINSLVNGLIEAAPLVLAAMGFTLIYYLNSFINVAYGENVTFGAYFAVFAVSTFGFNLFTAIVPVAIMSGLVSVALFLLVFRPAIRRGVGSTELIIMSVGLSYVMRYGLVLLMSNDPRFVDLPFPQYFTFLGAGFTSYQVFALGLVVVIAGALYYFLYNTGYGGMMRGLADNKMLATVSGINPTRVSVLIWFIAGMAAGLAGLFLGVFGVVTPRLGFTQILLIIMLSIVGGIGSVRGALIASIGAGILIAAMTLLTDPLYAQIILLGFFIVVLKARKVWGLR